MIDGDSGGAGPEALSAIFRNQKFKLKLATCIADAIL